MGGYSGGSSGGPSGGGTKSQAKNYAKKNEPTPIKDFIQGGGIAGVVIRGVTKAFDPKRNKTAKGDVYGGKTSYGYNEAKEKIDYKPQSTLANRGDNDRPTQKSLEQPKVASQMDNSEVKSDLITAEGPTSVDMTTDEILLKNKRKGRKRTILTSVTGVDEKPTLSKKYLLG